MEINIVIKTGNLYEEINKNINYILSKINKKITTCLIANNVVIFCSFN